MKPFVTEVLAEIDRRIESLKTLSASILEVFSDSSSTTPAPAPPPAKTIRNGNGAVKTERKPRGAVMVAIEAGRHIKEPFGAHDLAVAAGITLKNGGNYIQRWKAKGWITSAGTFGQYQRTKNFGGAATEQGRVLLESIHREIAAQTPETAD